MRPRLALCFSGHPRSFKICFDSINEQLLTKYNCDIFISTYFVSEELSTEIINLYNPVKINIHKENDVVQKNINYIHSLDYVKFVDELFDPNKIVVVDENTLNMSSGNYNIKNFFNEYETKKFCSIKIDTNALGQFFGIHDVSTLCLEHVNHNNISYDYILRLRLDDHILNKFEIISLEENEVLINNMKNYNNSLKPCDHFFMAKPNTFFRITSVYTDLNNIIQFINSNECWLPNNGYQETLLLIQIIRQNINIKESKEKFTITLLR